MKLYKDGEVLSKVSKALDTTQLVQVIREVHSKTGVYNAKKWVKPSMVKPTDRVLKVQQNVDNTTEKRLNTIADNNTKNCVLSAKYQVGELVSLKLPNGSSIIGKVTETKLQKLIPTEETQLVIEVKDSNNGKHENIIVTDGDNVRIATDYEKEDYKYRGEYAESIYLNSNFDTVPLKDIIREYYKANTDDTQTFDDFRRQSYVKLDGKNHTDALYKQADGTYTPERQELHNQIVQSIREQCPILPEKIVYLTGGGSACGKGAVVGKQISEYTSALGFSLGTIDSDEIKNSIPEYSLMQKQDLDTASFRAHNESSDIANLAIDTLVAEGRSFVFDGTMKNLDKYTKLIDTLHSNGYKVRAIAVDVPIEEAIKRAKIRGKLTGRNVPDDIIKDTHIGFAKVFPQLMDKFDDFMLCDNSQPSGQPATMIVSKSSGVVNSELWERFQQKAKS